MTVNRVRLTAGKHTWRISTDTGWTLGWWAFSDRGLHRAVRYALRSCGVPVNEEDTVFAVAAARRHGYMNATR